MLDIAVTPLLAAHLLAMNVASAGPLVGVWLARREAIDAASALLGRRVLQRSLWSLVVGSLLGGGLLLLPNAPLRVALQRFPAQAYWFAGLELLFSAACIELLVHGGGQILKRSWLATVVALLSATNLLYHFPPLMAVIGELAANPNWTLEPRIDRAALLHVWRRPEVIALWAHFILASLAVAPIAALWPWRPANSPAREASPTTVRRLGAWALAATILQIPIGLWLLSTNTSNARDSLMGSDLAASLCFAGGMLAALWLMQSLSALASGDGGRSAQRAGMLLIVVTVLMTATLRASRTVKVELAAKDIAPHADDIR